MRSRPTLFLCFGAVAILVIGIGMGGFGNAVEAMLASPATAPLLTRERVSPCSSSATRSFRLSTIAFPHIGIFCLTARRMSQFKPTVILYPVCMLAIWLPCVFLGVVANRATDVPADSRQDRGAADARGPGTALDPDRRAACDGRRRATM